jgi:hypothetical protein
MFVHNKCIWRQISTYPYDHEHPSLDIGIFKSIKGFPIEHNLWFISPTSPLQYYINAIELTPDK